MKVLSFLEFFNLTPQEKRDYLDSIGLISASDYKGNCEDDEIFFLYSYANEICYYFKPEMIDKFEGFRWFDENNVIKNDDIVIQFPDCDDDGVIEGIIYKLNNYWYFPRTLDDFINDCQRVGIELTWKVRK